MTLSLKKSSYSVFFILYVCLSSTASAQSGEPVSPRVVCEDSGGAWDDNAEFICAPCSPCISSTGHVRGDNLASCLDVCSPWCECPEGLVFSHQTGCAPANEVLGSCRDEQPEVIACVRSGGDWLYCLSSCTYCLSETGEKITTDEECPDTCLEGCSCPQGQSSTPEGCRPNEEVLASCEDETAHEDNQDREHIIESSSCHQQRSQVPLWFALFTLCVLLARGVLRRA